MEELIVIIGQPELRGPALETRHLKVGPQLVNSDPRQYPLLIDDIRHGSRESRA